jgi:hypothetical protein
LYVKLKHSTFEDVQSVYMKIDKIFDSSELKKKHVCENRICGWYKDMHVC